MSKQCDADGPMDKYGESKLCGYPATHMHPYPGAGDRYYCTRHYIGILRSKIATLKTERDFWRAKAQEHPND